MKKEQITKEWASSLSACKRQIVSSIKGASDFLVMGEGDAMPFIEEIASAYDYNIIYVKLQTLDDLRGTSVIIRSESGLNYYDLEVEWKNAIERSEKKSLLLFNIDNADNRLVNALKSIVERHGDKYFVGLICTDKTRDLKRTSTINVVREILWEN